MQLPSGLGTAAKAIRQRAAPFRRGVSVEELTADEAAASSPAAGSALAGASADRPLTDPQDDRLGYARFAQALADGIGSMSAPDGLVVAIYGAWGLGKTTVLNFVEHYLHESEPDQFVVVRFNPWWFSGRVDIAAAFFDQMRAIFETWKVRGEAARKSAAQLARVVGAVTTTNVGEIAADVIKGTPPSVPELKENLAKALASQDRRLLIVIDDIDRLTQDEVAELFGVVKGLADFPNTIYVLAFDREQVASALSGRTSQAGFDYLDKIVQVPFELPLPEREALRSLFFDHLSEIVGQVDEDLLDNEELGALLTTGLDPLMKTPRRIVRLTNSLRVTYGAVQGEVNVVDFIALEALRVFEPAVYDRIRARPDMFGVAAGLAAAFPRAREDEQRTYHAQWVDAIDDPDEREAVQQVVARLFPDTADLLSTRLGISRRRIDARRSRALSEADYFPLYFRFALGDQVLSRQAVSGLVALASDPDAFAQALLKLTQEKTRRGRTRASAMLDELHAQAEHGFAAEHIPGVIKSLTNIGDQLWIEGDDEFLGGDNATRIIWLIGALLERVPPAERCELLKTAARDAESVGTPTLLVRRVTRSLGVPTESSTQATPPDQLDEQRSLISIDCGKEVEQVAAEHIENAASAGRLWGAQRFIWLLAEWRRWSDGVALREWLNGVLSNDEQLGKLLLSASSERMTTKGLRYRFDPRWLDDFAPRADVVEAVRRLQGTNPGGDIGAACAQYLTELEMLEQGRDPEVRLDWDD